MDHKSPFQFTMKLVAIDSKFASAIFFIAQQYGNYLEQDRASFFRKGTYTKTKNLIKILFCSASVSVNIIIVI